MWKALKGLFGGGGSPAQPPTPDGDPPPAHGWDAIEAACAAVHGDAEPMHWAHKGVMAMHDLKTPPENPLDGVSIYDGGDYWHYVGFGLSELYAKQTRDPAWSGFGLELCFRLIKPEPTDEAPLWPVDLLTSLSKAVFSGSRFEHGHTVKCGPINGDPDCPAVGLFLVEDPDLGTLDTPHGRVVMLLLVGIDAETHARAQGESHLSVLAELRAENPALVTRV